METNKSKRTIRLAAWRKRAMPVVALGLLWLSAGCAMHQSGASLGERIAQATVSGGAQPEMAVASTLPAWSTPVSVAARPMPTSATMVAINPPTTHVAALSPSRPDAAPAAPDAPVVVAAPQADRDVADRDVADRYVPDRGMTDRGGADRPATDEPADRTVAKLVMPPALAMPPPDAGSHNPAQAVTRSAPADPAPMTPERAATEAAALTAAIPLPDPLPMPFVNRAIPTIGAGDAIKPRATFTRHSSSAPVAAPTPRIAALAVSPPAGRPDVTVAPIAKASAPVQSHRVADAAPAHRTAKRTGEAAKSRGKVRTARKAAATHGKSRRARKTASRRDHSRQPTKVASRRGVHHAARKKVASRRSPATRTAAAKRGKGVKHVADRRVNRPKPVVTDKVRDVVTPAEPERGWVGPLAPGSKTDVGVTHSSALAPRRGFSLASAAERLKSWVTTGRTRAPPRTRVAASG